MVEDIFPKIRRYSLLQLPRVLLPTTDERNYFLNENGDRMWASGRALSPRRSGTSSVHGRSSVAWDQTNEDASLDHASRYDNPVHVELFNAAREQQKITEKRLTDMLTDGIGGGTGGSTSQVGATGRLAQVARHISSSGPSKGVGGITSHVLDTCHGRPASGVIILLERRDASAATSGVGARGDDAYSVVSAQTTNDQGRVTLVENGQSIEAGWYRVRFDVGGYYERCRRDNPAFFASPAFYPEASVVFQVSEAQHAAWDHFHVPLTWSPFGWSTYRGS